MGKINTNVSEYISEGTRLWTRKKYVNRILARASLVKSEEENNIREKADITEYTAQN